MPPALRNFLSNRHGRIVVAQPPNVPLIAWAVFAIAARLVDDRWAGFLDFLSGAALVTWAYLEITQGESPFRRVLGSGVLLVLLLHRLP